MTVTAVFRDLARALDGIERPGVIHVGAHRGQEVPYYRKAGFDRIVCVEPNPKHLAHLDSLGVTVKPCAVGTAQREATLHVTRYSTEASLLEPERAEVVDTVTVPVLPLSALQDGCNVAVIDTQGTEADVLRSADLDALDAVIVECSTLRRYRDEELVDDIAAVLDGFGVRIDYPHRRPFLSDVVFRRR